MNPTDAAWFARIGIDFGKEPSRFVVPVEPMREEEDDDFLDLLAQIDFDVA